jgi:hypothetical protein
MAGYKHVWSISLLITNMFSVKGKKQTIWFLCNGFAWLHNKWLKVVNSLKSTINVKSNSKHPKGQNAYSSVCCLWQWGRNYQWLEINLWQVDHKSTFLYNKVTRIQTIMTIMIYESKTTKKMKSIFKKKWHIIYLPKKQGRRVRSNYG